MITNQLGIIFSVRHTYTLSSVQFLCLTIGQIRRGHILLIVSLSPYYPCGSGQCNGPQSKKEKKRKKKENAMEIVHGGIRRIAIESTELMRSLLV